MTVSIYALVDPRDGAPRYVGRSSAPRKRFYAHISVGLIRMENRRRYDWVRELEAHGLRPALLILETCQIEQAAEAELRWIERYRPSGKLFNGTASGLTKLKPLRHCDEEIRFR